MSSWERPVSVSFKNTLSLIVLLFFLPFLLYATYELFRLVGRAAGQTADITVDATNPVGQISTDFYHAFAQGGEEKTDMIGPIINQITPLKPTLIRLDHIFDSYDVVTRNGNDLHFNFSRLDQTVQSIRATGANPFLVLSYMPQAIARNNSVIDLPIRWEDWSLVVQKTIEHYSGKNALNLTDIHYEVWNEPDLAQFGGWKINGEKNYLTLYAFAEKGARQATNTNKFYLGGPGTTGLYKNWITQLINSGARIDFFSWHSYLEDPEQFAVDQKNLISWLIKTPQYTLLPTFITEYGMTGNKDIRYSTNYAAAYTLTVIRHLIQGGPDSLFTFELRDGPQDTNSGWGLLRYAPLSQPKPRYYAFQFADRMAGMRLALSGEGSWVKGFASTAQNTVRILLVNFDRNGYHMENVPVNVINLNNGMYSIRTSYLFSGGCAQDYPKPSQPIATISVNDGQFMKTLCIPAQNAVILELTPTT